jgi:hypothetical protein
MVGCSMVESVLFLSESVFDSQKPNPIAEEVPTAVPAWP